MPYLLLKLIFHKVRTAPVPFFVKPIVRKIASTVSSSFVDPNLTRHLAFLGAHLATHPWFAGPELTAADIQMSYAVEAIASRLAGAAGLEVSPRLLDLLKRMQARPAYQRALERGGPSQVAA